MSIKTLPFAAFAATYCTRQVSTPDALRARLLQQAEALNPDGWLLLECQVLDSSRLGEYTILPFGGKATFQTIPDHPISPRGLASDMSVVSAVLLRADL